MRIVFKKYNAIKINSGLTGKNIAEIIINNNKIPEISIKKIAGFLSDHYDPKTRTLCLTENNYSGRTITAAGVASHEACHVLQQYDNYFLYTFRQFITPITKSCFYLSFPLILVGFILQYSFILNSGFYIYIIISLFYIITLPIEINASVRAVKFLKSENILNESEINNIRKVLFAATLTYVAAMFTSFLYILKPILSQERINK